MMAKSHTEKTTAQLPVPVCTGLELYLSRQSPWSRARYLSALMDSKFCFCLFVFNLK